MDDDVFWLFQQDAAGERDALSDLPSPMPSPVPSPVPSPMPSPVPSPVPSPAEETPSAGESGTSGTEDGPAPDLPFSLIESYNAKVEYYNRGLDLPPTEYEVASMRARDRRNGYPDVPLLFIPDPSWKCENREDLGPIAPQVKGRHVAAKGPEQQETREPTRKLTVRVPKRLADATARLRARRGVSLNTLILLLLQQAVDEDDCWRV